MIILKKKYLLRILVICSVVLSSFILLESFYLWKRMGVVEISMNGWFALAVGSTITILLGCSLMALIFFSNRSGKDDLSIKGNKVND